MASHRRPKGIYLRDTTDWFSDRSAIIGAVSTETTNFDYHWYNWCFFNDSNAGQALSIYQIQLFPSGAGSGVMLYSYGPTGSFITQGSPAFSNGATPPGQLYLDITGSGNISSLNPLFATPTQSAIFGLSFSAAVGVGVFSRGPLVLQPGASILFWQDFPGSSSVIGVQYVVLPGVN